jgi:hypothetical protein
MILEISHLNRTPPVPIPDIAMSIYFPLPLTPTNNDNTGSPETYDADILPVYIGTQGSKILKTTMVNETDAASSWLMDLDWLVVNDNVWMRSWGQFGRLKCQFISLFSSWNPDLIALLHPDHITINDLVHPNIKSFVE